MSGQIKKQITFLITTITLFFCQPNIYGATKTLIIESKHGADTKVTITPKTAKNNSATITIFIRNNDDKIVLLRTREFTRSFTVPSGFGAYVRYDQNEVTEAAQETVVTGFTGIPYTTDNPSETDIEKRVRQSLRDNGIIRICQNIATENLDTYFFRRILADLSRLHYRGVAVPIPEAIRGGPDATELSQYRATFVERSSSDEVTSLPPSNTTHTDTNPAEDKRLRLSTIAYSHESPTWQGLSGYNSYLVPEPTTSSRHVSSEITPYVRVEILLPITAHNTPEHEEECSDSDSMSAPPPAETIWHHATTVYFSPGDIIPRLPGRLRIIPIGYYHQTSSFGSPPLELTVIEGRPTTSVQAEIIEMRRHITRQGPHAILYQQILENIERLPAEIRTHFLPPIVSIPAPPPSSESTPGWFSHIFCNLGFPKSE